MSRGPRELAALDASVQGWIAHVRYAHTWGLRAHLFGAPELPLRTFCTVRRESSPRRQLADGCRILLEELSGLSERPMIIRMTAPARKQRYDIGSGVLSNAPMRHDGLAVTHDVTRNSVA